MNSADVLDMTPFKSNIALLTRDSVVVLNSSAKEVARLEHNYSDPDMAVYKGRALVYDRTSGDFTLMNSSKILGDGNGLANLHRRHGQGRHNSVLAQNFRSPERAARI